MLPKLNGGEYACRLPEYNVFDAQESSGKRCIEHDVKLKQNNNMYCESNTSLRQQRSQFHLEDFCNNSK